MSSISQKIKRKSSILFGKRPSISALVGNRLSLNLKGINNSANSTTSSESTNEGDPALASLQDGINGCINLEDDVCVVVTGPPKVGKTVFCHALRGDNESLNSAIEKYEPTLEDAYMLHLKLEKNSIELIDTGGEELWAFEDQLKNKKSVLIIYCLSAHDPKTIAQLEKHFTSKAKMNFNITTALISLVHDPKSKAYIPSELLEEYSKQHLIDGSVYTNLNVVKNPNGPEMVVGDLIRKHRFKMLSLAILPSVSLETPRASARGSKIMPKLFGESLENIMMRKNEIYEIPQLIDLLISYLEIEAIKYEGVFRVSAVPSDVENLKLRMNASFPPDFKKENIHSLCSLFKCFLRELPDPVTTIALYEDFMAAAKMEKQNERVDALKQCLSKLPKLNYNLLSRTMKLLYLIQQYIGATKMNSTSLGVTLGMTIMRASKEESSLVIMQQIPSMSKCCEQLIDHYITLFT